MPGARLWAWWLLRSSFSLQAPAPLLPKAACFFSTCGLSFLFILSVQQGTVSKFFPPSCCPQIAAHSPLSFEAMVLSCLYIRMWWAWTSHCKSSARILMSTQRGEGQVQGLPFLPTSQNYSMGDKIIDIWRDKGSASPNVLPEAFCSLHESFS